ncbi:MAG: hypothetical protein ABI134_31390 [Byssovorax sp.]
MAHRTDNRSPRRGLGRAAKWALAVGAALALLAPADVAATPATFTFIPPNPGWVPALLIGAPVNDPAGDIQGPRDIVGDAANPMLFVASDATHLYWGRVGRGVIGGFSNPTPPRPPTDPDVRN